MPMERYYDLNVYKDSEFMCVIDGLGFKKEHEFCTLKDMMNKNDENWILFDESGYYDRLFDDCVIFIITSKRGS